MRDSKSTWQTLLAEGFKNAHDLLSFLELPQSLKSTVAEASFKTRVPIGFANLMEKGNPNDPLLKQVLASNDETIAHPAYTNDPLDESTYTQQKALIHKYPGRVLLIVSRGCAVHCRYCFRRHFPYELNNPSRREWQTAFSYIKQDPSIHEVILSGGDPLIASDNHLLYLLENISSIAHVSTVRIHSRMPIVLPERIDKGFLSMFESLKLKKVMVMHANHPNELDERVFDACERLKSAGFLLLNQSVILNGVNDCPEVLASLSKKLFEYQIVPYYLHTLDKVSGAMHFDMPKKEIKKIYQALQARLPGYLVPKLVSEVPGALHKVQVN